MDHRPNKRQKVGDNTSSYKEEALFNSDTLSKIISYLPSVDVLNLALTNKKFGISDDDKLSVIKKSTRIAIQDTATEEQLGALPHYDGESSLADYHYLQLLQAPLMFDQLVGAEYVDNEDKSCVRHSNTNTSIATAFSNNIMRAGKHYVSFIPHDNYHMMVGVMRPGQANESAEGLPIYRQFFQNFSPRWGKIGTWGNNKVHCCMYNAYNGWCHSSSWTHTIGSDARTWEGSEHMSSDGEIIGMLLDLDEGTLSVYKNGRKLGVMKRGLAGPYCWVVSKPIDLIARVRMERGTIPPN